MMTNLFSSFDPSTTIFNFSLNWTSTLLALIFIPSLYWMMPSRFNYIWNTIILTLNKEFSLLLTHKNASSTLIFISLFSFIMFNNFIGLFPYIFTSSSHLVMTISLALPLWLSFMLYGWINNMNHMFIHLVPLNTPTALMPFMVLIESISNMIRPGTLAVRLTANMIAGHLLLTLLANMSSSIALWLLPVLLCMQILLMTLETAVAFIQSYVFSVLSTLYSKEVN
uniref:ATP synthase subunit a n=1 Tax=Prionoglaris stygia TaxID=1954335 RepID=A0A343QCC6_9NEOP|nr:ATP synthase F0 subunit 6 [Prionoglaris stygia]ATU07073.1 ATP synthase F0 subunit 6 [Prionoglaris stygia]